MFSNGQTGYIIFLTSAESSFRNSSVQGNFAGAIVEMGETTLVDGVTFYGNTSCVEFGGVLKVTNYKQEIKNCVFTSNTLNATGNSASCVNFVISGPFSLVGCEFNYNKSNIGSAVYSVENCELDVIDCTFTGNNTGVTASSGACVLLGTTSLTNCTFTGNSAIGSSADFGGGAIYAGSNSLLEIYSCTFTNNNSSFNGGAIYTFGSLIVDSLNLQNLTTFNGNYVSSNSRNTFGGAIAVSGGLVTINSGLFVGNYATASGSDKNNIAYVGNGGVIASVTNASIVIKNAQFNGNGNEQKTNGGVVYSTGNLTINNITGDGNKALNGGNVYVSSGYATIQNTTFTNAVATNGGGMYLATAIIDVNNVNIFSSTANQGGAIYASGPEALNIFNSNLSYNNVTNGGALFLIGTGTTRLSEVTIQGNYSSGEGGAVYVSNGSIYVYDTTISGNGIAANRNGAGFYGDRTSFTFARRVYIADNFANGEKNENNLYVQGENGKDSNLYLVRTALSIVDALAEGSLIGAKTNATNGRVASGVNYILTSDDLDKFFSDDETKTLKLEYSVNSSGAVSTNIVTESIPTNFDIIVSNYVGDYDGELHTVNVQVFGVEDYQIFYSNQVGVVGVTELVEGQTAFRDVGEYTVYVVVTSGSNRRPVSTQASANVIIRKQTVVVSTLPTVENLTISSVTYPTTLSSATIKGGVAEVEGFEIAGSFEWVAPNTRTAQKKGYQYYAMKFVPESTNYAECEFTILVYVGGFKNLYYFNQGTYNGFYVNGNTNNSTIGDRANNYFTTSLETALDSMEDNGIIYMISTYNLNDGEGILRIDTPITITIARHILNANALLEINSSKTSNMSSIEIGKNSMAGTLVFDGGNIRTTGAMVKIYAPNSPVSIGGNVIFKNHNVKNNTSGTRGALEITDCGATPNVTINNLEMFNCHGGENGSPLHIYSTTNNINLYIRDISIYNCSGVNGGAVYIGSNVSASFLSANITKNSASNNGGGVYIAQNSLSVFYGADITSNTALNNGGGVYLESLVNIYGLNLSTNTAGFGGGMYVAGNVTSDVTNVGVSSYGGVKVDRNIATITGNVANGRGAGIYNANGGNSNLNNVVISNNILTSNSADSVAGLAGSGIVSSGATFTEVTISSNFTKYLSDAEDAVALYGAFYSLGGTETFIYSNISNNSIQTSNRNAVLYGAGISTFGANNSVVNIKENSSIVNNWWQGSISSNFLRKIE